MANFQVHKLYKTVVEDVIGNVRESFLDDGVEDQVLQELKQLWETKLMSSKAVDPVASSSVSVGDRPARPNPRPQQQQQQQHHHHHIQPQHSQQGVTIGGQPGGQVPVFAQIPGMSRAASQATIALPANMYGGAFPPGSVIQTDQGTIILQTAPQPAHLISSQANTVTRPMQPMTIQTTRTTPGNGMLQLDGANDQLTSEPSTEEEEEVEETVLMSDLIERLQSDPQPSSKSSSKKAKPVYVEGIVQLDGGGDSSTDDDDDDDDDKDDDDVENEEAEDAGVEEEPLNSEDDVSDEDPSELFDTDNVIVCQYDKINRCKNKWKFILKDGIMSLRGRDYVFQRAAGDAEW